MVLNEALRSARSGGAVGKNAIVPRIVKKLYKRGKILDFGAGPQAIHTRRLKRAGRDVTAFDLPQNSSKIHDPNALKRKYDIVFASNVINVQSSLTSVAMIIKQLASVTKIRGGVCLVNLPNAPQYVNIEPEWLFKRLQNHFRIVTRLPSSITKRNRVFECRGPVSLTS